MYIQTLTHSIHLHCKTLVVYMYQPLRWTYTWYIHIHVHPCTSKLAGVVKLLLVYVHQCGGYIPPPNTWCSGMVRVVAINHQPCARFWKCPLCHGTLGVGMHCILVCTWRWTTNSGESDIPAALLIVRQPNGLVASLNWRGGCHVVVESLVA